MKVIGVYRKCDILTLTGGAFALSGIICCFNNKPLYAIFCLIIASICDAFDGAVARKSKSSPNESAYGVELDSLCDVISFGVLPMVIVQCLTSFSIYTAIISVFFCLCGVIRLAYFNMLAITKKSDGKSFIGFPIPISAIVIPLVYFILELFELTIGNIVYPISLFVCGVLFIVPVKLRKPSTKEKTIFLIISLIVVSIVSYFLLSK